MIIDNIKLKELLAENDMTQRDIAEKLNVTPNTIWRYCSKNYNVPIMFIYALSGILNIKYEQLIKRISISYLNIHKIDSEG